MQAELKIRPLRRRSTYSTSFRCFNGLTKVALNDSPSEKCDYPRLIGGIQLATVGTDADRLFRALRACCIATLQEKQSGVGQNVGAAGDFAHTQDLLDEVCEQPQHLYVKIFQSSCSRQERFEHPSTEYIILLLGV
jgi:hypothetical protein